MSCTLVNVQTPLSMVVCRIRNNWGNTLVNGMDLRAGRTCALSSTTALASCLFSSYFLCSFPQVPPDKPRNVRCETWRSALFLECTWARGWETHLNGTYNVSVSRCGGCCQCCRRVTPCSLTQQVFSVVRENGTQILARVVDGKSVKVPRSLIDEDGKYQVNVTACNRFGSSRSDPVSFCLEDMGAIHHLTVS